LARYFRYAWGLKKAGAYGWAVNKWRGGDQEIQPFGLKSDQLLITLPEQLGRKVVGAILDDIGNSSIDFVAGQRAFHALEL
jgi:hypothetical protein